MRRILLSTLAAAALILTFLVMDMWTAFGSNPSGERRLRTHASPQWKDKAFSNRLPEDISFLRAIKRFYFQRSAQSEAEAGSVKASPIEAGRFAQAPASGLRVTWFGHSSLYVEIDGRRILIDPVWGKRASPSSFFGPARFHAPPMALEDLPVPDAVVFSHDHYDHLDLPTIRAIRHWDTRFIAPLGLGSHLEAWGVPSERIVEKDWWEEEALPGGLRLACVPARHFSGRGFVRNRTLWSGWALLGSRHRFYYSGDTAYFHGFKQIGAKYGPFDASCIELGAYDLAWPDVHIGPEQAVQAWKDVKGGLLLPVHWGTFSLAPHGWTEPAERLIAAAQADGVPLAFPRPGQSVEPSRPPKLERWWPALPWQTATENPIQSTGL